MGKYEQGELLSQIESYSDAEIKPVRPRNIPSPASEKFKQTQVNYSAFGWQFQIVAAIVLSLIYRKKLMKVKVEGKTEDIELYLKNEDPIFIQAKSTTQKMDEFHGEKTPLSMCLPLPISDLLCLDYYSVKKFFINVFRPS